MKKIYISTEKEAEESLKGAKRITCLKDGTSIDFLMEKYLHLNIHDMQIEIPKERALQLLAQFGLSLWEDNGVITEIDDLVVGVSAKVNINSAEEAKQVLKTYYKITMLDNGTVIEKPVFDERPDEYWLYMNGLSTMITESKGVELLSRFGLSLIEIALLQPNK